MASQAEELKDRQRAMWAAGDYPDIARLIESVSAVVVEQTGVEEGQDLLDVATGTGNAALAAARRGARVTGLDLTPELLEVARERAGAEGLRIDFEEGDAEQLPFEDASFDFVTSVFGVMFAPGQQRAAAELLRVRRPGGMVAVSAWTPGGLNGQLFATIASHMPPPPEGFRPPILWGDEATVRELFAGGGEVRCELRRAEDTIPPGTIDEWLDYTERVLGPVLMAKQALEPEGRWEAARADLQALYERFNEADDGTLKADPEYLLTTVR